jgi:hypothetical protein
MLKFSLETNFRNVNAWMLRTVRRIGRHPQFCTWEELICDLFLILFAAVLLTYIVMAVLRRLECA